MRGRRLLTVPGFLLLACAGLLAAPLWIPALALIDALRPPPRAALRCGLFFQLFFLAEALAPPTGLHNAGTHRVDPYLRRQGARQLDIRW